MWVASARISIQTEADIIAAVEGARARGNRVRAVGSGGSKNGGAQTDGVALLFHRYRRVLAVDGNRVTVRGGIACGELNAALARAGLALPTVGEWKHATVAGALATGVHGGSSRHGIMATSVRALRVVTGQGAVIEVDRSHERFPYLAVSLGALGIISTVTFECEPAFSLGLERRAVSLDRYLMDYARENRDNEFYSAVWFPAADAVITFAANRTPVRVRTGDRPLRFNLGTLLLHAMSRRLKVGRWVRSPRFHSYTVAEAGDILTPIGVPPAVVRATWRASRGVRETEFAVRAEDSGRAIALVQEVARQFPGAMANAVGLRSSAGDRFALSPCSGRESFWVSVFYRPDVRFEDALCRVFDRLEARCHWGKHIPLSPRQLHRRYPGKDGFLRLQAQLDPDGLFANDFTERLGLTWPRAHAWAPAGFAPLAAWEDLCWQP